MMALIDIDLEFQFALSSILSLSVIFFRTFSP